MKKFESFPILSGAVIGGLGEHPDPVKRSHGFGAVQLYIPKSLLTQNFVDDFSNELSSISKYSLSQTNYRPIHHRINEASRLWSLFELYQITNAGRKVIASNGYVEFLLSIPFEALNDFLAPELIQQELMLPYMAIDQEDQSKCIPIWYDDLEKPNDFYVDGNYSEYVNVKKS